MVNMSKLEEALDRVTAEYKLKTFKELSACVNNIQCFSIAYDGKSYSFEVHSLIGSKGDVKVMIECSRNLWLFNIFGKHRYFSINPVGKVSDIDGSVFWAEDNQ